MSAARGWIRVAVCTCALSAPPVAAWAAAPAAAPVAARELAEAEQAYQAGDLAGAGKLYAAMINLRGDNPWVWFRLGLIHQREHSLHAALTAYDNALTSADVDNPSGYAELRAKIRFNRALMLLETAAADLGQIAPGVLEPGHDIVRGALSEHVNAALLAAGTGGISEPPRPGAAPVVRAQSYVYVAPARDTRKSDKARNPQ